MTTHVCKCPEGNHLTFGACMRSKNLRVGYCQSAKGLDATKDKRWNTELHDYREARRQGVYPDSTKTFDIRGAMEHSERTGVAYGSNTGTGRTESLG